MSQHSTTVEYEDLTFSLDYDYYPACRGRREDGQQMEPDEPATWEVTRVFLPHFDHAKPAVDVTDVMSDTLMNFFNEKVGEELYD